MANSPFKFLDSFTKDDKEIFFGREKEIEEIYSRVFQSNLLLVYGASGTGKTSLIQCGLSNKFNDSDWLPIIIRRGSNIQKSIQTQLGNLAITPLKPIDNKQLTIGNEKQTFSLKKSLQSLYLDHFKPIYLLFDQFEELFIFGTKDEIENFIVDIAKVIKSDLQCKFIFIMRGEYLEHLTQFEEQIPTFFDNRIRIEKMTRKNAMEAISGPCKVFGIEVEEGFPQLLLDKISSSNSEIELTYLQVFLDKIYKKGSPSPTLPDGEGGSPHPISKRSGMKFTNQLLSDLGQIGDVLSDFLEEQIAKIPDSENALTVLKAFVSAEGTKRQINFDEINEFTRSLGKDLQRDVLENFIHQFVNLRILRDKDEHGKYELRHDSLAAKIYEKITLVEKEILQVRQMIANRFSEFEMRGILLSDDDLRYIAPYENRLFLRGKLDEFYKNSKRIIETNRKLKKRVSAMSLLSLILLLAAVSYYLYQKNLISRANELAAMSLINVEKDPTLAYLLAEEAYQTNPKCELAVKALLSSYNGGPFYNTIIGNEYAVSNDSKHIVTTTNDSAIRIYDIDGKIEKEVKLNYRCIVFPNSFSKDGSFFLTSLLSRGGGVDMWNLQGKKINSFLLGEGKGKGEESFMRWAFSNDGRNVIIYDGKKVSVFDFSGKKIFHYEWTAFSNTVTFSTDDMIAFANDDQTVKIFDLKGNEIQIFKFKDEIIHRVNFSPDGKFIKIATFSKIEISGKATNGIVRYGSPSREVTVWTIAGKLLLTLKNSKRDFFSPDSKYVLTIEDNSAKVWTLDGKMKTEFLKAGTEEANPEFIKDRRNSVLILVNYQKEFSDVYDLDGNYSSRLKGDFVGSSGDGNFGLTVDDKDNSVGVYNNSAREIARLSGSNESLSDNKVKLTPDNKYLITGGNSEVIRIWKPDFRFDKAWQMATNYSAAFFSPDGNYIAMVPSETPKVFDKSGNFIAELRGDENRVVKVKFSPDNKYILTMANDYMIKLWNISGKTLKTLTLKTYAMKKECTADFSSDSKYLAVMYQDENKVKVYNLNDLSDGKSIIELKEHKGHLNSVAFSPSENFLVSASSDSTAIIWKFNQGKNTFDKFGVIKGHSARVNSACFSSDGKYIVTASDDSTARIWNLFGEEKFGINIDDYYYVEREKDKSKLSWAGFSQNRQAIMVDKYKVDTVYYKDPITFQMAVQTSFPPQHNIWFYRGDWGEPFFEKNSYSAIEVSGNSNSIAFEKDQNIKLVDRGNTELISIKGNSPKFSPDGKTLMILDNGVLKMLPVTAEETIRLIREEKIFGNIRDFTEEEKEEFEIE